jgi:hypothetical protein
MRASGHGAVSLLAGGAAWLVFDSFAAAAACLISGLLLDVDHLLDYFLHQPRSNTLGDLVDVCENCRLRKVILPLHSWELVLPVLLAAAMLPGQRLLLIGLVIGLCLHLLADQLSNPVTGGAYFFIHRWRKGFRRSAFFDSAALERHAQRSV